MDKCDRVCKRGKRDEEGKLIGSGSILGLKRVE